MTTCKTIEIGGLASALTALKLPYSKQAESEVSIGMRCEEGQFDEYINISLNERDLNLMQTLIQRGDEHAKPLRGILAWVDINAPLHFWGELETYQAGHQRLFSESTMHTEGRGLSGYALEKELESVSFARMIRKVDFFSYQTLRRIVVQRCTHRKLDWHYFIDWIASLPLAQELILVGLDAEWEKHEQMKRKFDEEKCKI